MKARAETIGDCTLYLGDMRDIVPTLNPVDCIATDAPYMLESGGANGAAGQSVTDKGHRPMSGKFDNSHYQNNGNIVLTPVEWDDFMPLLAAAMPRGHAYFMCNNRHVMEAQSEAIKSGFRFHNLLVWDKGTGTPNRWYMKNCEFTLMMFRGKSFSIADCGSRQLMRSPNILNAFHPTEKPSALMEYYICNSTKLGEIVLDPFMGAGSTAVACANSGRKFIGCEIVEKYFDEACRRVEAAYKSPSLFRDAS